MISTNRKSTWYYIAFLCITLPIVAYSWFESAFFIVYSLFLSGFGRYKSLKWYHTIITGFTLTSLGLFLFASGKLFFIHVFGWDEVGHFICIVISIIPIFLFFKIFKLVERIVVAANIEKEQYHILAKFPDVACIEHNTRATVIKSLAYKRIKCRVGNEDCFNTDKLIYAKEIIGRIGKYTDNEKGAGVYYINIWHQFDDELSFGDFDKIEIYENTDVEYNAIISKVIQFLDNDVNFVKRAKNVNVKVFGRPDLSNNTMRLMDEKLGEIEYVKA